MTIRFRITTLVIALVVATVALVGASAVYWAEQEMNEEVDTFLIKRTEEVVVLVDKFGQQAVRLLLPTIAEGMGNASQFGSAGVGTRIILADGTLAEFSGGDMLPPAEEAAIAASADDSVVETFELNGMGYRMVSRSFADGGTIQVARDMSAEESTLRGLTQRLVLLAFGIIALGGALAWWLSGRITRSLSELSEASMEIAETRDLSPLEMSGGPSEVQALRSSFNEMLGALARSKEQQRRLVHDAGHELRTPLTVLKANAQLLSFDDLATADRSTLCSSVVSEVDHLAGLVDELVLLGGDGPPQAAMADCDVAEIARASAARLGQLLDRVVNVNGSRSAPVVGDAAMLERAVSNLIDNAAKFSEPDTEIDVRVTSAAFSVEVSVRDRGVGIPDDELPRVFQRFHRARGAQKVSGSGLGLSIVEHVAEHHGGGVFAHNVSSGGALIGFSIHR